jgi:hypothetical protein
MEIKYPGEELIALGFKKVQISNRGATHKYELTKPIGLSWPENVNLINFCDGTNANFGGSVNHISSDRAIVNVYVD